MRAYFKHKFIGSDPEKVQREAMERLIDPPEITEEEPVEEPKKNWMQRFAEKITRKLRNLLNITHK